MRTRDRRRDESGAVAVLVATLALVLFGLAALVVDLGLARDTRRQAQNTADAAALAAANALYASGSANLISAVTAAKTVAAYDFGTTAGQWSTCADGSRPAGFSPVAGQTACISFNSATSPTEVRVVVPAVSVSTPFGRIFGTSHVNVSALAQAKVTPGGKAVCGLCILGTGTHNIQNGDISVDNASIYFNGTVDTGPQGSAVVTGAGQISMQGARPTKGTFSPIPLVNQPAVVDPLSFLSLPPNMSALSAKTVSACGAGGGPGIYTSLGVTGTCTLSPGLYVVTGTNHLSGQEKITAPGVTFYFACQDPASLLPKVKACASGQAGGNLLMTGQGGLDITAPTTGQLAGVAVLADRNNTATQGWRGLGAMQTSGTIYLASGTLNYRGNGAGLALDSLVVVGDIDFSGNPSQFKTKYTQSTNIQLPPGADYLSK